MIQTHSHDRKYTTGGIFSSVSKYTNGPITVRRENIIPAQFHRLNNKLGEMMNKNYVRLSRFDELLKKTPLNILAQAITVISKKT